MNCPVFVNYDIIDIKDNKIIRECHICFCNVKNCSCSSYKIK